MPDREKQINLALQTVAWSRMVLRVAGPNVSKSAFAGQGVMQAEDFASVFEHHDTVIAALLMSMLRASRLPLCVDIAARTDLRLGRFVPANHKETARLFDAITVGAGERVFDLRWAKYLG
jgi:hypothetical protein